jgi:hypothetical protein
MARCASNGIASTLTGITRFTRLLHGDIEYLFPDGSFSNDDTAPISPLAR